MKQVKNLKKTGTTGIVSNSILIMLMFRIVFREKQIKTYKEKQMSILKIKKKIHIGVYPI